MLLLQVSPLATALKKVNRSPHTMRSLVASVVVVVGVVVVAQFPGNHRTAVSWRRVMLGRFHQLFSWRHLVAALYAVAVFHVVVHLFALFQIDGVVMFEVRYTAEFGVLNKRIRHSFNWRPSRAAVGGGTYTSSSVVPRIIKSGSNFYPSNDLRLHLSICLLKF